MSSIAFSTNVPHTVRGRDGTKQCTDCHVSDKNDNNALMAQLLMHGTNYMNFVGKYAWVAAGEHGLNGVVVTERDEPQAVIGSSLHSTSAFPDRFRDFVERSRKLEHAHEHPGRDIGAALLKPIKPIEVLQMQNRGEYLLAACGEGGLRAFDIAFIDDKAFAERITTAPVSPLGQRFYVPTKYAAAVAAQRRPWPPTRRTSPREPRAKGPHRSTATSTSPTSVEALILVGVATLIDVQSVKQLPQAGRADLQPGRPALPARKAITIVGTYAYVGCDAGLVVVDLNDPKCPRVASVIGEPFLKGPKAIQVQFRYCYVCDEEGIKVLDVISTWNGRYPWRSCGWTTSTTSTWPGPTPTSPPATAAWLSSTLPCPTGRGSTRSTTPAAGSTISTM